MAKETELEVELLRQHFLGDEGFRKEEVGIAFRNPTNYMSIIGLGELDSDQRDGLGCCTFYFYFVGPC